MDSTPNAAELPLPILSTREQAARFLGVSKRQLDYWLKAEAVTPVKLGRLVRIHRDELLRVAHEGITVTRDPKGGDV